MTDIPGDSASGAFAPTPAPPTLAETLEARRLPITLGLMLTTVMIAIDTTVVNVSLPHMAGNLSASPEQITWVLTSFIVAQAVMTPISGWLAARLGSKTMLLGCVVLFTLTSVLCGAAQSLPQMVAFRLLQGISGAPMLPLSQAVLLNINPPERIGRAMALFSMATVVGPIAGPVLGAYITEDFSWRWCFYINLPAGIASLILLWTLLPKEAPKIRRFDFLGFGSLAVGVAALQLMLDRGSSQDWFNSREIWIEAIVSVIGFWVFIAHTLTAEHPLFPAELVRDRNFVASSLVSMFVTVLMFGSIALMPLLMQTVLGYPVILAGLLSMPRGVVVMVMLQIIGRLDSVIDRRLLIGVGMLLMSMAFWRMASFDLDMEPRMVLLAGLVQGVGQGLITVPLTTVAFATLSPAFRADGSSISNLIRMLGGSVGIAVLQGLIVNNGQKMHESLAAYVRPDNPVFAAALPKAMSPATVEGALALNAEITRQSDMVAFLDDFRMMAVLALFALPLLLLLRRKRAAIPPVIEPIGE